MRHPWVSAERPKYIFHVPVHIIFPEIRDSYAAKIKHPMDLTTAEAKVSSKICFIGMIVCAKKCEYSPF
jgi:hypothetical protein